MKNEPKFNPKKAEEARIQIGEAFRQFREQRGLTHNQLASCAGMTQPQLSRFEIFATWNNTNN